MAANTKHSGPHQPLPPATRFDNARRRFLAHTGMYTAGLMGSALLGACSSSDDNIAQAQPRRDRVTDTEILNFALNLEYLEAEFYLFATRGSGIPDNMTDGQGSRGTVSGGKRVNFLAGGDAQFSTIVEEYANEIANDEFNHVKTLRAALGSAAVAEPRIALDSAFKAALGPNFDYSANPTNFLLAAFLFEDVGVTAYKGAAPLIRNPGSLSVAAGFLAAEAYHASLIRTVLYSQARFDGDNNLFDIVDTISNARDALDDGGETDKDQGIRPTSAPNRKPDGALGQASNIVPLQDDPAAPDTGAVFGRDPANVLNIVYLTQAGAASGGFFPDGVNGQFTQASSG